MGMDHRRVVVLDLECEGSFIERLHEESQGDCDWSESFEGKTISEALKVAHSRGWQADKKKNAALCPAHSRYRLDAVPSEERRAQMRSVWQEESRELEIHHREQVERATALLRDVLQNGPMRYKDLKKIAKEQNISPGYLRNAAHAGSVKVTRPDKKGELWQLDDSDKKKDEDRAMERRERRELRCLDGGKGEDRA